MFHYAASIANSKVARRKFGIEVSPFRQPQPQHSTISLIKYDQEASQQFQKGAVFDLC